MRAPAIKVDITSQWTEFLVEFLSSFSIFMLLSNYQLEIEDCMDGGVCFSRRQVGCKFSG